jgi:hypothetical protein
MAWIISGATATQAVCFTPFHALEQSAGQAGEVACQFKLQQARLQGGGVEAGAGEQGVQSHRVGAQGLEQGGFGAA